MPNLQGNHNQGTPRRPAGQPPARRPAPPQQGKPAAQRPAPSSSAPPPRRRRARVKYRWFRALLMVIAAVVGSGFLAIFLLQSFSDLFGLEQIDQDYTIMIPEGSDLDDATEILSTAGVIDKDVTFRLYAGLKFKEGDSVKPGEYALNSNMGYDEIILKLKNGVRSDQIVRLTITEGMTLLDIAKLLDENGVCDRDAFLEYLDTTDFNYNFFRTIKDDPNRYHKLEGYIFPDTYEFYVPERVSSIAKKFLDNFDAKISEDMLRRMQAIDMTLDETIILASVIQKEASMPEHIRRVSSVFHNRLDTATTYPHLQSDVTIFYVEDNIKPFLSAPNQEMYDAYNTYVSAGLPVGPVCNPGLDAINAALYPAETDYYFFVTDVNMEFYYASTLQKHNENIREAAAVDKTGRGEVHGIGTQEPQL